MNDGVKILLARMETHPEEFVDRHWHGESKWGRLIDSYRSYLTKEDVEALDQKHRATIAELMQQRFTEDVMEALINPHENMQQEINFRTSGNVTLATSQLLPGSNVTYTSDPLVHKHSTTFGRLYNHERNND